MENKFQMGIIKDNHYSIEELKLAKIGRALGHPVRRKIIDYLQNQFISKNTDLSRIFNLSVPSISDHLDKLKDADLIKENYSIHFHEISLNPEGFTIMREYLNELNDKFENFS